MDPLRTDGKPFASRWLRSWRRYSLCREVVLVLVSKTVVLMAIWWMFFSDPVDETLGREQIAQRLLGSNSVQASSAGDIRPAPTPQAMSSQHEEHVYGH